MALKYRTKKRRFFRRRRRTYYRRRFKRYFRRYKKSRVISKAKRFINKAIRKYKRTQQSGTRAYLEGGPITRYFQNIIDTDALLTTFDTNSGWISYQFSLSNIFDQSDLDWILNNYYSWRMESFCCSICIIDYKNFYRFTDCGGALTNIAYTPAGNENMNAPFYTGFFRLSQQYTDAIALDPEANLVRILETNVMQRPRLGRPATFRWINNTGHKGEYVNTTGNLINTSITTAFGGSMPTHNEPYGWGIALPNRSRFIKSTVTADDKASIRIQISCNACIRLRNKKTLA